MKEISEDLLKDCVNHPMACPECGGKLYAVSGCFYCPGCGFLSCEQ